MSSDATIREARDIISRWSSSDMLDRITSLPPLPEFQREQSEARTYTASGRPASATASTSAGSTSAGSTVAGSNIAGSNMAVVADAEDRNPSGQQAPQHEEEALAGQHEEDREETQADQDGENLETDDSSDILNEVDRLAKGLKLPSEKPPWLKLAEIERPQTQDPYVNVDGLFSTPDPGAQNETTQNETAKDAAGKNDFASSDDERLSSRSAADREVTASARPKPESADHSTEQKPKADEVLRPNDVDQPKSETSLETRPENDSRSDSSEKSSNPSEQVPDLELIPSRDLRGESDQARSDNAKSGDGRSSSEGSLQKSNLQKVASADSSPRTVQQSAPAAVSRKAPRADQQPPLLSALLKSGNAESVGQLAWNRQSTEIAGESPSKQVKSLRDVLTSESAANSQSASSEPSSQPESLRKQTKSEMLGKSDSEDVQNPINLNTSDQSARKTVDDKFQSTRPAELLAEQTIQQEEQSELDRNAQDSSASEQKRAAVPRKAQQQKQHSRNLNSNPVAEDQAELKGTNTVSRKYRVDNPNPESSSPEQSVPSAAEAQPSGVRSNASASGRRFRIDSGEDIEETLGTSNERVRTQGRSRKRYIDEPHADAIRGPHFQVTARKRSNVASMTGQFLAYLGVLGLTIGTAIVIYGHFGGVSEYTPTGWLVTTVAQMMLFLGVINLVSGGIEQNNEDVSTRINTLGEQLMRIEQVTEQALRGPKIPASRYADPDSVTETTSEREAVRVEK